MGRADPQHAGAIISIISTYPQRRAETWQKQTRENTFQSFHAGIFEADLKSDLLLVSADSLTY